MMGIWFSLILFMVMIVLWLLEGQALDNIEKISSIFGSGGIFFLTVYVFWLTYFSKNIKITSYSPNFDIFLGNSLNVTIYNKTLSPQTITSIKAIVNNKDILVVKDFSEPLLLEPFHTYKIIGDRYSNDIDASFFQDIYFKVGTSEKTINVKFKGKIKKKENLEIMTRVSHSFNGEVISNGVKYVLLYWRKGTENSKRVLILNNGLMNENIFSFNVVPNEILGKQEKMVQFFKEQFNDENWCFIINEIGR